MDHTSQDKSKKLGSLMATVTLRLTSFYSRSHQFWEHLLASRLSLPPSLPLSLSPSLPLSLSPSLPLSLSPSLPLSLSPSLPPSPSPSHSHSHSTLSLSLSLYIMVSCYHACVCDCAIASMCAVCVCACASVCVVWNPPTLVQNAGAHQGISAFTFIFVGNRSSPTRRIS